jgi:hypothetical protein
MSMVLDIFFDHICGHLVPYRSGKVSIFPKFAPPKFLFNLRKYLKNPSGGLSLQTLDNLRNRISRCKSQKYMYMILGNFHRLYFKFIGYGNFFKTFFNKIPNVASQYPFAIFGRPYQVVARIIYRMTRSSDGHAEILIDFQSFLKDDVSSPP